jgi:hypothetical protein
VDGAPNGIDRAKMVVVSGRHPRLADAHDRACADGQDRDGDALLMTSPFGASSSTPT